jgi:eukaryotic-like serine/threonine-protein kinase
VSELDVGANLSHYRIVSKLGAGGMGEVYLAQDTKLDRQVALEILPAEVAADEQRMDRFLREAKSASALNHPNIVTIYEIQETDEITFIALELIDGETLRYRIQRGLNVIEGLDILIQVSSAHRRCEWPATLGSGVSAHKR